MSFVKLETNVESYINIKIKHLKIIQTATKSKTFLFNIQSKFNLAKNIFSFYRNSDILGIFLLFCVNNRCHTDNEICVVIIS